MHLIGRAARVGRTKREPWIHGSTVGVALVVLLSLALFGRDHAFASLAEAPQSSSVLRITSPVDSAVLGEGNLVVIEGVAVDRLDGVVDRVEMAFDNSDAWIPTERVPEDPTRWRYLWSDPVNGFHRIRVRAFGIEDQPVVEQNVIVDIENVWSTPFIIDNPYARAGAFRKGQIHMHTTASFDGWRAMPPAHEALAYKDRGYQFVILTDHDVVSYPKEVISDQFLVIPGYESTADSGHITGAFVQHVVDPGLPPQQRIDDITSNGGLAVLNHPGWRIGWTGTDFSNLHGYFAFEIYNGVTSNPEERGQRNAQLWQDVLNTKGWQNRIWAVAVDDSHEAESIDRAWIMAKAGQLTESEVRRSLEQGAFYSSNGPSFGDIGVSAGAIIASSPEASTVRFIDQDGKVVMEASGKGGSYRPTGKERWVRVEAIMADGRTAWSQPFWIIPNAPKARMTRTWAGTALVGESIPGARIHLSDRGDYLGSVVANSQGQFMYRFPRLTKGDHEFWMLATAPWPDQVEGPPATLAVTTATGPSPSWSASTHGSVGS